MLRDQFPDQRRWFVASPYYVGDQGELTRDITVVWALTTRQAAVEGIRALNRDPATSRWLTAAKAEGLDVIGSMNTWPVDTDEYAEFVATRGAVAVLPERSLAGLVPAHR